MSPIRVVKVDDCIDCKWAHEDIELYLDDEGIYYTCPMTLDKVYPTKGEIVKTHKFSIYG